MSAPGKDTERIIPIDGPAALHVSMTPAGTSVMLRTTTEAGRTTGRVVAMSASAADQLIAALQAVRRELTP
jgi:hypothetical protein